MRPRNDPEPHDVVEATAPLLVLLRAGIFRSRAAILLAALAARCGRVGILWRVRHVGAGVRTLSAHALRESRTRDRDEDRGGGQYSFQFHRMLPIKNSRHAAL
jgi:hypothetical protein